MRLCRIVVGILLLLLPAFSAGQDSKLNWDWRSQEVIGRNDPSVGNTSRLTEPERSSLMDAIVLRLQKPMSDAGYDDDRIREIASTTRLRFVDLGDGKPLLLATSLGLEGGCDALANCPLWIFRRTDEGFLSLLTAIAASFTVQPGEGGVSDLVLMHHITPRQSGLRLYHYADHKLIDAGCFEALWPKPSDDPTQLNDPDIQPCKEERLNQYGLPVVKPLHPNPDEQTAHPIATVPPPATQPEQSIPSAEQPKEQAPPAAPVEQPAQEAPSAEPPKEQAPASQELPSAEQPKEQAPQNAPAQEAPPAEQPKEQAKPAEPSAQEAPKSEQSQPATEKATGASQETPKQDQAQPPPSSPPASEPAPKSDQGQQPAPEQQPPDAGQSAPAPKSDQAPTEQPPSSNQDQPKADQAQPSPDQQPAKPDTAQPPPEDKQSEPTPKQDEGAPPAANQQQPAPQSPNPQ